jgi:hypothetical protein
MDLYNIPVRDIGIVSQIELCWVVLTIELVISYLIISIEYLLCSIGMGFLSFFSLLRYLGFGATYFL